MGFIAEDLIDGVGRSEHGAWCMIKYRVSSIKASGRQSSKTDAPQLKSLMCSELQGASPVLVSPAPLRVSQSVRWRSQ